jgi:protein-tyrosine phosphatase
MVDFIDTHAHLIPFVDDGAENWDVALAMLQQGFADGIKEAVCTSHILSGNNAEYEQKLAEGFAELQARAKAAEIPIRLHLGAELFVQPNLDLARPLATLGQNGRYFLVEFPMNLIPDFVAKRFFDLVVKQYTPIVAHPERNGRILSDPQKAFEFVERGALLQLNAGSLLGVFGQMVKSLSIRLLQADLIHIIATDAHDTKARAFLLSPAYAKVVEICGEEKARDLFYENPRRVLAGQDVVAANPKPLKPEASRNFLENLGSFLKKIGI